MSRDYRLKRLAATRDSDKIRYRYERVVNLDEGLEAEEDDDTTFDGNRGEDEEPDEVVADGPWE